MPLLALTLLLLSGIHPEAHAHEHDTEHAAHCHGHDHDSGESGSQTESSHGEKQMPICACACHGVAADRSVSAVPVVEELTYAKAPCPTYALSVIEEPLLDIFHPPKLSA